MRLKFSNTYRTVEKFRESSNPGCVAKQQSPGSVSVKSLLCFI